MDEFFTTDGRRAEMLTKEELRQRFISEGAPVLFAHIREQDEALAEARGSCACNWCDEARRLLLAHSAPKGGLR
jgi:hypothetical protein